MLVQAKNVKYRRCVIYDNAIHRRCSIPAADVDFFSYWIGCSSEILTNQTLLEFCIILEKDNYGDVIS